MAKQKPKNLHIPTRQAAGILFAVAAAICFISVFIGRILDLNDCYILSTYSVSGVDDGEYVGADIAGETVISLDYSDSLYYLIITVNEEILIFETNDEAQQETLDLIAGGNSSLEISLRGFARSADNDLLAYVKSFCRENGISTGYNDYLLSAYIFSDETLAEKISYVLKSADSIIALPLLLIGFILLLPKTNSLLPPPLKKDDKTRLTPKESFGDVKTFYKGLDDIYGYDEYDRDEE